MTAMRPSGVFGGFLRFGSAAFPLDRPFALPLAALPFAAAPVISPARWRRAAPDGDDPGLQLGELAVDTLQRAEVGLQALGLAHQLVGAVAQDHHRDEHGEDPRADHDPDHEATYFALLRGAYADSARTASARTSSASHPGPSTST